MRSFRKKSLFPLCLSFLVAFGLLVLVLSSAEQHRSPKERQGRRVSLYEEADPILVTGNVMWGQPIAFHPEGDPNSGLYDSDGDGVLDKRINTIKSFVNAANNCFNEAIAACVAHDPDDRFIYYHPDIWTDDEYNPAIHLRPDSMPRYADSSGTPSTNATQFVQVTLPFEPDPAHLFDLNNVTNNYLSGEITLRDETGSSLFVSAFLGGSDAFGTYHGNDPNWPAGALKSSDTLVLVANTATIPSVKPGIPDPAVSGPIALTGTDSVAFEWSGKEVYLQIGSLVDKQGFRRNIASKHLIRRTGVAVDDDDTAVKVVAIMPSEYILHPVSGYPLEDHWPGITGNGENFVPTDARFMIVFNKPVVPVTVGRSIVFNRGPFTGNMEPVPNRESMLWQPHPACSTTIEPICSNVALKAYFLDELGDAVEPHTPVPVRIHPLSQNNLASYIVTPLIDLPGSSTEWSGDLPGDPPTPPAGAVRMRIEVTVYDYQKNALTGLKPSQGGGATPQNLGVAGFHGERFYQNGQNATETFSVLLGARYVNAPVSPNVVYVGLGTKGIGALDLDGNGFTTHAPSASRNMWITASAYYSPYGNGMMGVANDYAYPVGVGSESPIEGINEGGTRWWSDLDPSKDALVRDSTGSAALFEMPMSFINDIEVGDFLDTIYYDRSSPFTSDQLHLDLIYVAAAGNFLNNLISSPPTPNPPPLTLPVAMRPLHVVVDELGIHEQGAFVMLGKEVFPPDLTFLPLTGKKQWIHLDPAGLGGGADKPFPPNPPGLGPWAPGSYLQDGPLAETCTFGIGYSYASRQQIGNFLFATDRTRNSVHVLNSNTMEPITEITGFAAPAQAAITSDLEDLFVTNLATATVTVIDVNPRSPRFLLRAAEIPVGQWPKGICCQPDGEDVLVCNYGDNTISIIEQSSRSVRKTLTDSRIDKPWDMVAAPRQHTFGWGTGVYHAYISNFGGNNLLVYESGPDGLGGIGLDDIYGAVPLVGENGEVYEEILEPRGLCYDPCYLHDISGATNLVGGCFVAHNSVKGAAVSRIQFVDQRPGWGPYPPGSVTRDFFIVSQWTAQDGALSGTGPAADVALPDLNREAWLNQNFSANPYVTNWGGVGNNPVLSFPSSNKHPLRYLPSPTPTFMPDLLFVSYINDPLIDLLDRVSGTTTCITGLPHPAGVLESYFKN